MTKRQISGKGKFNWHTICKFLLKIIYIDRSLFAGDFFTEKILNYDPNLGESGPEIGGLRARCTLFRLLHVPCNIDYA